MKQLQSYCQGRWHAGGTPEVEMRDATTGAIVATSSSEGLDFEGMLNHARNVGGPNLRRMTTHERAVAVKEMAADLMAHRDDFAELSYATGATAQDRQYDLEGGILTAKVLSSTARQALPNTRVIPDGPPVSLSRDGSFVGQHVYTPKQGVAIQINAYNFPVWGMLEKLAPAVIAGVPSVVKPAPQTAFLTAAVVERIITTGHLPEGALQLVVGEPGKLLDHVTGQDIVAFTGSAATARKLKTHSAIVAAGTTFSAEQDSLNAAILGPDADAASPEFDLYVREIVSEITAKAGQRCTCIRRVLVPHAAVDAISEALAQALRSVVIGDPRLAETQVGPLVTQQQRETVRQAVTTLSEHAELIVGDPEQVDPRGGTAEDGAFLAPMVLRASDPWAQELHTVEAFGPVATVMPFDDLEEAVALTNAGRGSLVSSLFTNDRTVAEQVVRGAGAYHGRIHMVNREVAKSQSGHGSPLPTMVHGGPGRAGGGEELGGVRSVFHFMQRTALQGPPALLTAATDTWLPGADTTVTDVHPMAKPLEDVHIGDQITIGPKEVNLADIEAFAHSTGDHFYAHMDAEAVTDHPFFEGRVAHGYLLLSYAAGMFVYAPKGPLLANQGLNDLQFGVPFYPGDAMTVTLTCKQKSPRTDQPYGEVRWDTRIVNQDGQEVASYELLTVVAKSDSGR